MRTSAVRFAFVIIVALATSACGKSGSSTGPDEPGCLEEVTADWSGGAEYIAFGDSLTFGSGDENPVGELGYPPTLEGLIHRSVHKEGVPGEKTWDGSQRIGSAMAAHPGADYILIMEGANDLVMERELTDILDNITAMIEAARERGVTPILVAVPPAADAYQVKLERLNGEYLKLCEEQGVWFLDDHWALMLNRPELMEWIHPNDAGYDVLAESIANELLCSSLYF